MGERMDLHIAIAVQVCTALSILSPGFFISIREAVKIRRQEIITDLATVFDAGDDGCIHLIPSFEFVKYKYFVGHKRARDPELSKADIHRKVSDLAAANRKRKDFSVLSWIIGCGPFSALVGFSMLYTLSMLLYFLSAYTTDPLKMTWPNVTYPRPGSASELWLLGICAAFTSSYITSLRNLLRAIRNFDLSPAAIVSETIKILLSMALAPVITLIVISAGSEIVSPALTLMDLRVPSVAPGVVITSCFVVGIMLDVALRWVTQRDQLKNFKREESEVFQAFKITPIEIVDGIDSEIRSRLEDHHIHSTQNLAAANPLMLFVETPFGVYQIMDWVAQAQLCCSVGRDRIIKLWPLGVRTLFDLERLAADDEAESEALLLEVGRIILGSTFIPSENFDRATAAAVVRRSIELRLDDPHVQRLRQIYIAVGDRLGRKSRRFIATSKAFPHSVSEAYLAWLRSFQPKYASSTRS